jgi:uncharacterized GH25 family protein
MAGCGNHPAPSPRILGTGGTPPLLRKEGKPELASCVNARENDARFFVYIVYVKKIILLLSVCIVSVWVLAHEFWLQPQKFHYSIREVARIRFLVGEGFKGDNWSGNKDKVQELLHYTPSGNIVDVAHRLSENKGDSLQLPLQEEGTHMVIFNSTNSLISLESEKFNAYLKEDGLNNAAAYRKENKEENKTATEHYQRSIKTLLQVSYKLTDACTKPCNLPLDIIPEKNPYQVPVGASESLLKVKFRVLYKQEPLNNALVKIWYYPPGRKEVKMDTLRTNKRGWITANRHAGPYLVSCVYMEHTPADKEAEWQSYWASLSFEYSQFYPGSSTR